MKNLKKKGFTIVELVIVIAVIAVLAAVLIPTFVNLTKKANQSADFQATRQMNVVLTSDKYATIEEAVAALAEAGYNALDTLTPVSTGYSFWWVEEYNSIVLLNEKAEVVFASNNDAKENFAAAKEAGKAFNLKRGLPEVEATNVETARDALENGQSVTLTSNLNLELNGIKVSKGEDVVIDLGGNTLTVGYQNSGADTRHKYAVDNYGTVTIKNGTIEARGVQNFGTLVIEEGVVIKALDSNGGACVWNENGTLVINGGTFSAPTSNTVTSGASLVANTNGKVVINGGTFTTQSRVYAINNYSGEIEINGGNFTGTRGVLGVTTGKATINGGSFNLPEGAEAYCVYSYDGIVTIKGGTFNGGLHTYCVDNGGNGKITLADGTVLSTGNTK